VYDLSDKVAREGDIGGAAVAAAAPAAAAEIEQIGGSKLY
jgi:hypothetical protein